MIGPANNPPTPEPEPAMPAARTQDRRLHGHNPRQRKLRAPSPETVQRVLWLEWLVAQYGEDSAAEWAEPPVTFREWTDCVRPVLLDTKPSDFGLFTCPDCGLEVVRHRQGWRRDRCVPCQEKRDRRLRSEREGNRTTREGAA